MKKICIVTTRHISYNPRVLKEADALQANGFEVSVVTINNHAGQRIFDEQLMRSRKWTLKTVNYRKELAGEKGLWIWLTLKNKLFGLLSRASLEFGIAERAVEKAFDQLQRLAGQEKADLYIVHHAEALGVGYRAARANLAKLAFDAEDFHTGMGNSATNELVSYLEKKYLPHCTYVTAASAGIGKAYANKYGIDLPVTILNTFSRETFSGPVIHEPVRFYWYSQVIGPERGLEMLIDAAGKLESSFEVHLRGSIQSPAYKEELMRPAAASGISEKIFFHEPILPGEIIQDGNLYDVGLALESDVNVNRNICVTNKVFSYLMSGLALVATDTEGQKDILGHFPAAGRLCPMNDPAGLAAAMQFYIDHPDELLKAKRAAADAAKSRFNWEFESQTLLNTITRHLS